MKNRWSILGIENSNNSNTINLTMPEIYNLNEKKGAKCNFPPINNISCNEIQSIPIWNSDISKNMFLNQSGYNEMKGRLDDNESDRIKMFKGYAGVIW